MTQRTDQVRPGWKLLDARGQEIGTVREVRADHLVVEHGTLTKNQLYVPVDRLADRGDDTVSVDLEASDIDSQGWRFPPQAGFERPDPVYPEVPDTTMMEVAGYSAGRLAAPETQAAVHDATTSDETSLPEADVGPHPADPGAVDAGEQVGDEAVGDQESGGSEPS